MEWLELHIDTNHAGLEVVETFLSAQGIDGVVIDDETDFQNFLENNLDMSALSRFDVWVAQLSAVNTYNGSYGMWQHSWSGSVSGINGSVDLNTAYRNYPAIIKNSGKDISAASRDIDISLRITTSPIAQDGSTAIQKYQFGDTTLYVSVKAAESTL